MLCVDGGTEVSNSFYYHAVLLLLKLSKIILPTKMGKFPGVLGQNYSILLDFLSETEESFLWWILLQSPSDKHWLVFIYKLLLLWWDFKWSTDTLDGPITLLGILGMSQSTPRSSFDIILYNKYFRWYATKFRTNWVRKLMDEIH